MLRRINKTWPQARGSLLSRCSLLPSRGVLQRLRCCRSVIDWPMFQRRCVWPESVAGLHSMPVAFPQAVPSPDPDGSPQPAKSGEYARTGEPCRGASLLALWCESAIDCWRIHFFVVFNVPKSRQRYRRTQSADRVWLCSGGLHRHECMWSRMRTKSVGVSMVEHWRRPLLNGPEVDLALLQVPADLIDIEYADSARLRVGISSWPSATLWPEPNGHLGDHQRFGPKRIGH